MKKIILLLLTIFSLNLYSQVPEPVSEQKDHIILFNGIILIQDLGDILNMDGFRLKMEKLMR